MDWVAEDHRSFGVTGGLEHCRTKTLELGTA